MLKRRTMVLILAGFMCMQVAGIGQDNLDRKSSGRSKQTVGQRKWVKLIPTMSKYRRQRIDALVEHVNQIRKILRLARSNVSTKRFVDEMMGLESLFRASGSRKDVEAHIEKMFARHVLDGNDLATEIQKICQSFNQECIRIDNDLIVACGFDISFDPRSIAASKRDSKLLYKNLAMVRSHLTEQLYTTVKEQLLATGVGFGVGSLGASLGHELGKDANGDATWLSVILGTAGGIAAEQLAEQATLEVLETRKRIDKATARASDVLLLSFVGDGAKLGGAELDLKRTFQEHESMVLSAIVRHLKIEPSWANKHLPK